MAQQFDPTRPYLMINRVQDYDWGSVTAIPELLGNDPDGKPQAELWMGAHPKAPSGLLVGATEVGLAELIERYPVELLGRKVVEHFGKRLPFLFKVLAAARALSIQAHPNLEQAREGFRRENQLGLALSDPRRDYQDDNHKPEVICALTEFWGMCGFRRIVDIREDLASFEGAEPAALRAILEKGPDSQGLRLFLDHLLHLSVEDARTTIDSLAAQCRGRSEPRFRWVRRLARDFPGDPGAVAPLFLNVVRLLPGEAMYLGAGELHAYLEGTGIELMANSDNVLRGGLTTKHIDVEELLRVLNFRESSGETVRCSSDDEGAILYATPISEFRLAHIEVNPPTSFDSATNRSVEILFCVSGDGQLSTHGVHSEPLVMHTGSSVLVPAAVDRYTISGGLELYRADVPQSVQG